jgi:hypothetical protein
MNICLDTRFICLAWKLHLVCIILPSVACMALPYFSALSRKWLKYRTRNVCSDFLSYFFSKTFLTLKTILQDITNLHSSSHKVHIILHRFSEIPQTSNFMKSHTVRAEILHADRRMDRQT